MKVSDVIDRATKRLAKAGVPSPEFDTERLLARTLAWSQIDLISRSTEEVPGALKRKFDQLVARREKREPLQYITGTVEFAGLRLDIDRRALIPRPETELIVDEVLAGTEDVPLRALDACTGSGALALAIKKNRPRFQVCASDISPDALKLARQNADKTDLEIRLVRSDLFTAFRKPFRVITVNPPYIADPEFRGLQAEVRDWEPRSALTAGADGMDILRRIPAESVSLLWPGGLIAVELAPDQARAVADLFEAQKAFDSIRVLKDFQGYDRVVVARRWKSS